MSLDDNQVRENPSFGFKIIAIAILNTISEITTLL